MTHAASPPRPPTASPRSRSAMSPANIRTSSIMCWTGRRTCSGPRALHPIFFGSFDWHSCVHGYWLLLRTLRLFPDMPVAARDPDACSTRCWPRTRSRASSPISTAPIRAASSGLMAGPGCWRSTPRRSATRPTGPRRCAPLAAAFAERFKAYLPRLTYPIRTGTHFNTAFALILALDWAEANDAGAGRADPASAPLYYYGDDRACPGWEPGGDDFLSPALTEALLMRRVLAPPSLPRLVRRLPARSRRRRAAQPVHARLRLRPLRRQDRPSRRPQPQPRLVLARPRRRARPGPCRARPRAPPTRISTPACRTSPATIWASTGWRPSPCWRWREKRGKRPLPSPTGCRAY